MKEILYQQQNALVNDLIQDYNIIITSFLLPHNKVRLQDLEKIKEGLSSLEDLLEVLEEELTYLNELYVDTVIRRKK